MPELPDVEVYCEYFEEHALKKEIKDVELFDDKVLRNSDKDKLKDLLINDSFKSIERYGKWLIINTDKGNCLAMHFGMTGYLKVTSEDKNPDSTRISFEFDKNKKLLFVDQRKFGGIEIIKNRDELIEKHELGTDALKMEWEDFKKLFKDKRGMVKPILMDQKAIAGIGNIYTDEILFQAGIHPTSKVPDIKERQLKTIFKKIHEVLKTAIKHHADRDEFPENYLTTHRKKGESWDACDGEIEKTKVGGRPTYACPSVQH